MIESLDNYVDMKAINFPNSDILINKHGELIFNVEINSLINF